MSWYLEFSGTIFWMQGLICFYLLCNELGLVKKLNGLINLWWRLRSRLMLPPLWNWSWSGLWTPEVFKGGINSSGNLFKKQSPTMFILLSWATICLWFQLRYIIYPTSHWLSTCWFSVVIFHIGTSDLVTAPVFIHLLRTIRL